jgi:ribulose bisphosphate carboxylase small subunit
LKKETRIVEIVIIKPNQEEEETMRLTKDEDESDPENLEWS